MQRDVTAATSTEQIDAGAGKLRFAAEQVLGAGAATEGDHRLVLHEQHRVPDAALSPRLEQALLKGVHRCISPAPEPDPIERALHSAWFAKGNGPAPVVSGDLSDTRRVSAFAANAGSASVSALPTAPNSFSAPGRTSGSRADS
jgi:hypothetical protein